MATDSTAIDFFYEKIKSHFEHDGDLLETIIFTASIAKLKEKKQIKNAFNDGYRSGFNDSQHVTENEKDIALFDDAENYYNQQFK
jgi:tRNA A-37 threonylcarbamoyl transferase component Bud32